MTTTILRRLAIILPLLLLVSCGYKTGTVVADIEGERWPAGDVYSVGYMNADTVGLYDISVFLVHDRSLALKADSIPLTITTLTPDSLQYSEQWMLLPEQVAVDKTPVWIETTQKYRIRVRFAQEGNYEFTFAHTLPEELSGVSAIGVDIVKTTSFKKNGKR